MIDQNIFHNKKVAFHTLGCKLNFAETSAIGKKMSDEGFVKVRSGEEADVCVINTCSVTDTADRKCRQAISKLHRQHPNAIMVVTGCYAQLKPEEISKIEGVDLVLGANEKFSILEHLRNLDGQHAEGEIHTTKINKVKEFRPSCSRDDRTRYFLKVQDGCDYYCTYCTIPFARGRSRSASVAETVEKAMEAIEAGAREENRKRCDHCVPCIDITDYSVTDLYNNRKCQNKYRQGLCKTCLVNGDGFGLGRILWTVMGGISYLRIRCRYRKQK